MERLSPAAGHDSITPAYDRHRPEETVLYGVVQSELESFLARVRDRPLPRFVEREFHGFLECGILAHGFLRVHCDACGRDRIVAFSCKGRGFCPSCLGRRMADTAAHLVDRVLPEAPVRQWVLTLPFALRYRLAYDAALTSVVLRELVRGVFASYRRRARQHGPIRRPRGGAVTFVQRFGDALNLNVHFHTLMLDGVYERYGEPGMRFRALPPPKDDEVRRVVERVAGRVARLMDRHADPSDADPLASAQPTLAGLAADSVRGLAPGGGRPARRGDRIDPEDLSAPATPRCAAAMGFTLHADVAAPARDRRRLERLCRLCGAPHKRHSRSMPSVSPGSTRIALCTEKPECLHDSNPAATSSSSRPRSRSIRITRRRNSSSATSAGGSASAVSTPAPSRTPAVTRACRCGCQLAA